MPKFKNIGLDVHAQRSALQGGPLVASGDVLDVDGELTAELDDGYVVGSGDDARVWPKSQWQLVKAAKAASVKED